MSKDSHSGFRQHLSSLYPRVPKNKITLPLRYKALTTVFHDSSNEELIRIRDFLDNEFNQRDEEVMVVLSTNVIYYLYDYSDVIVLEVASLIVDEYIDSNENLDFLTTTQRLNLQRTIVTILYNEDAWAVKDIDTEEDIGISDDDLTLLIRERHDNPEYSDLFNLEFLAEPNNPFLVTAVANLIDRGVEIPDAILYTVYVPLGKILAFEYDSNYGMIPVISDV